MPEFKIKITQEILNDNKDLQEWEVGDIVSFVVYEVPVSHATAEDVIGGRPDDRNNPPPPPTNP